MTLAIWATLFAGFQLGLGCLMGSFIKFGREGGQPAEVRLRYRAVSKH